MCFMLQSLVSELRGANEMLSRAKHEKLMALRAYKSAEDALAEAKETLPPLKIARYVNMCRCQIIFRVQVC